MMYDSGSGIHNAYFGSCLLSLDANISISGVWNNSTRHLKTSKESIHLWESWNYLDARSAIRFSFSGICAADMYTPLFIQNSQISVVTLLHNMDLTSPCLFMYDIAALLSVITLRRFVPICSGSREKIAHFIAVSSNTFICNLDSPSVHLRFMVWCLSCATQPLVLASLYIVWFQIKLLIYCPSINSILQWQ